MVSREGAADPAPEPMDRCEGSVGSVGGEGGQGAMASGFEAGGTGSFHSRNVAQSIGHLLGYACFF